MDLSSIKLYRESDEPLHLQLAGQLRRRILSHPGATLFLPSERSLSLALKLNRSTVHRAYEALLQEGAVRMCSNRKLEILPGAKRRLAGAFPSIGVLLPEKFSLYVERNNGSTLHYLKGIFDRAAELNCSIYTLEIPSPETPADEVNAFIGNVFHKLIGIIHLGGRQITPDKPLETVFECNDLPQIFLSGVSAFPHIGSVYTDFTAAALELVKKLKKSNCRSVGLLSFKESGGNRLFTYAADSRLEKMKSIFISNGFQVDEKWEIASSSPEDMAEMLDRTRRISPALPDFFWCMNDDIALRALEYFKSNGISVPQDVQIAGYDGIAPDSPLTTIAQRFDLLGAGAVDLLMEHFESGINNNNRIKTVEAFLIPGSTIKE